MKDLNDRLLAAHAAGDKSELVALYTEAADQTGNTDEMCFFLVQAYIFALDTNNSGAQNLRARLKEYGRED